MELLWCISVALTDLPDHLLYIASFFDVQYAMVQQFWQLQQLPRHEATGIPFQLRERSEMGLAGYCHGIGGDHDREVIDHKLLGSGPR